MVLAFFADPNKLAFTETLWTSLFSMLVVFLVLLIISYLVDINAYFSKKKSNKDKKEEKTGAVADEQKAVTVTKAATSAAPAAATPAAPAVASSDVSAPAPAGRLDASTVAIMMAAIKAYEEDDQDFVVRKIVRSNQSVSGWEQASIQDGKRGAR